MREVIFIKSLCQDIVLFLYKTVNFKTTTESLGKNSRKIPLCNFSKERKENNTARDVRTLMTCLWPKVTILPRRMKLPHYKSWFKPFVLSLGF